MINHIALDELRGMTGQEGLILQGCGGDPQEWLDGINEILAEEGILLNGDQFRKASVFEHGDLINILFHMEDVELNIGKLAMWRLQSHGTFGSTWLSDYLPNRLGIHSGEAPRPDESPKPDCPLIGADNNIFSLIGIASRTLRENGLHDQVKEMRERAMGSGSYDQALGVIMDYVNPVSIQDVMEEDDEDWCREPEYIEDDWPEEEQDFGTMGGMA